MNDLATRLVNIAYETGCTLSPEMDRATIERIEQEIADLRAAAEIIGRLPVDRKGSPLLVGDEVRSGLSIGRIEIMYEKGMEVYLKKSHSFRWPHELEKITREAAEAAKEGGSDD